MTNAEYHRDKAIGSSGLKLLFERSPFHYWAEYLDPDRVRKPPTPAMQFGTALHTAVLEPDQLTQTVAVVPSDAPTRQSKAGKEWWDAWAKDHAGMITLPEQDYVRLLRTRDAVLNHPIAGPLLEGAVVEESILWTDPGTGAACKARPDARNPRHRLLLDLKSTDDASKAAFQRTIATYRYGLQAAWYTDAVAQADPQQARHGFAWIAAETQAPHGVAVYLCGRPTYLWGRAACDRSLATYAQCRATGHWPSYPLQVQEIDMPRWALKMDAEAL